jgi:DNA-binding response OmpR family regulator
MLARAIPFLIDNPILSENTRAKPASAAGAPLSVLVVDDSPGICQTLSMILRKKGFEVACAITGPEAVARSQERAFDRILLDIRLPGFDGVEVQRRIRESRPEADIAIMTAYADQDKISEAMRAGASKLFYKPLDMDALLAHLSGGKAHE